MDAWPVLNVPDCSSLMAVRQGLLETAPLTGIIIRIGVCQEFS
jgi:hypothetical protein